MAAMAIEFEEVIALPLNGLTIAQIGVIPDVAIVVLVKALHIAVALRVLHR
jgi:hypothetical protein